MQYLLKYRSIHPGQIFSMILNPAAAPVICVWSMPAVSGGPKDIRL